MSDMPQLNVLLIVHEEQFKHKIATYLSAEGFHVFEPDNEGEVADIFSSRVKIHVAIVDIQVEERKGLRWVEYIKHNHKTTEVIMLNNQEQIASSIQGMRLGAFDDIMVPFDMKLLKEKINMAHQHGNRKQRCAAS